VALLVRRRRTAWIVGAATAGAAIGLIRIGEGGHFLSDVVFAGVIMALVVALVHWLVFDVAAPRVASEAAWHERTRARALSIREKLETWYAGLRKRGARGGEDDPIGPPF
jgi:membrane-associated phospholipid phosphatase